MSNQIETALEVTSMMTNFGNTVNSVDPVASIVSAAQLIANFANLKLSSTSAISVINANATAAITTIAKIELDLKDGKSIKFDDALSLAGNVLSIAIAVGVRYTPAGNALTLLKIAGQSIGGIQLLSLLIGEAHASSSDQISDHIGQSINDLFTAARGWANKDPLSLDLDGDGIEAVGASSTILFDHDGDGVKSGTGWLSGDDGLLVLDKNGNGQIDNGTELFGVDYVKSDGGNAAHGFDALSDLDSNGDGVFDSQDARYADVRVWRDLNQDGISDANELASLADHGIASIDLGYATRTINLGNGNRQSAEAAYTRTDGGTGLVANLDNALTVRTRLKPYLDEIDRGMTICESRRWRDGGKVVRKAANEGVWRWVA